MLFNDLISVLNADDTIHVVQCDDSLYFGTVRNAFDLLNVIQNKRVSYVTTAFCGILIEVTD